MRGSLRWNCVMASTWINHMLHVLALQVKHLENKPALINRVLLISSLSLWEHSIAKLPLNHLHNLVDIYSSLSSSRSVCLRRESIELEIMIWLSVKSVEEHKQKSLHKANHIELPPFENESICEQLQKKSLYCYWSMWHRKWRPLMAARDRPRKPIRSNFFPVTDCDKQDDRNTGCTHTY